MVDFFVDLAPALRKEGKEDSFGGHSRQLLAHLQRQEQNAPAFMIQQQVQRVVDSFRDPNEREALNQELRRPNSYSKSQIVRILKEISGPREITEPVRIDQSVVNSAFLAALSAVSENQLQNRVGQCRLGKQKFCRLSKLRLAKRLMPVFSPLTKTSGITKRQLSQEIGISPSFLRFLVQYRRNPRPFEKERETFECELAKVEENNSAFISFFKRHQLSLRTRKELWMEFLRFLLSCPVRSISDFDRKLAPNRITRQKVKLVYDHRRLDLRTSSWLHFIERFAEAEDRGHQLLFFDETDFELRSCPLYA